MRKPMQHFSIHGFTLLEMMVSSAIGILLMTSLAQAFQLHSQLSRAQSATEEMAENSAFALGFLYNTIQLAGFNIGADAPVTSNSKDNNGSASVSDQIEIQFTSNGQMTDCQSAQPIAAGTRVRNRFYVQDGSLMCRSSLASSAQPLVEGVLQMQVQYGEDTDEDQSVNQYLTYAQIQHPNQILSARIALLVASTSSLPTTEEKTAIQLLETTIPAARIPANQQTESFISVIPFARF